MLELKRELVSNRWCLRCWSVALSWDLSIDSTADLAALRPRTACFSWLVCSCGACSKTVTSIITLLWARLISSLEGRVSFSQYYPPVYLLFERAWRFPSRVSQMRLLWRMSTLLSHPFFSASSSAFWWSWPTTSTIKTWCKGEHDSWCL